MAASDITAGDRGERLALRYLVRRGWRPVATNWEGAGGELDIVVRRRQTLAIVEVKTRADPGALVEPVGLGQRRRIVRAATALVARRHDLQGLAVRFDLVTVDCSQRRARLTHLPAAFDPPPRRRTTPGSAAAGRQPS